MFSLVSVCLFIGGFPCDHYLWWIGTHCTGFLELALPPVRIRHSTPPNFRHGIPRPLTPLLVTSGSHHWRPAQTCSLEDPPYWYWQLVAIEACMVGKWAIPILLECCLLFSLLISVSLSPSLLLTLFLPPSLLLFLHLSLYPSLSFSVVHVQCSFGSLTALVHLNSTWLNFYKVHRNLANEPW